jgi:hypothetical protein
MPSVKGTKQRVSSRATRGLSMASPGLLGGWIPVHVRFSDRLYDWGKGPARVGLLGIGKGYPCLRLASGAKIMTENGIFKLIALRYCIQGLSSHHECLQKYP